MPSYDPTRLTAQQQADLLNLQVQKDAFGMLAADYTLVSQTGNQKLFNWTPNGALTLPTGIYVFSSLLNIDTMSATSGNGVFDILGAGTATLASIAQQSIGLDATTQATQAAASAALSITKTIQLALAATGTAVGALLNGQFNVTVAGTIIPSIALDTAAAALVRQGSFFRCVRLSEQPQNFVGAWG